MIRKLRAILVPLALLPGFLLWAAFPPMGETTDVFFALAALLFVSRGGDARKSAKLWFFNGLLFWVLTLSWFPAIIKNGGPWPLVLLGWAGLAVYCSLYSGVYGWLVAKFWAWQRGQSGRAAFCHRAVGILVIEPVLWAGLELARSRLMGGFAWNQLGVAPVNAGFGAPAALGGVYLLSIAVVLVNGTLAGVAERLYAAYRREPLSRWRSLETFVPVLLVLALYEVTPRNAVPEDAPKVRIALVQRNFPCCFSGEWEDPVKEYSDLLANVAPLKPWIVVLPESAMSEFGQLDSPRALAASEWLTDKAGAAVLIAGGSRTVDGRNYNSAAFYRNGMRLGDDDFYDKVHLVPFGEFIPGDKLFPVLQKFAPVGTCHAGSPKLLGGYGVAICFEDTDSALMRRYAELGANALVFITNDSWFSRSNEAVQHAWQARARAIETGLTVLRTGNSGVTGWIAPDGEANWLNDAEGSPLVDRGAAMVEMLPLPENPPAPTPYVRYGDRPLLCAFLLALAGVLVAIRPPRRPKFRELGSRDGADGNVV